MVNYIHIVPLFLCAYSIFLTPSTPQDDAPNEVFYRSADWDF